MDEQPGTHRRRKRKPAAPLPGPDVAGAASGEAGAASGAAQQSKRRKSRHHDAGDAAEHGLRDIVGAGRSQLGVSGALRGRDVNRPTDEDIVEAEQSLTIVRRRWSPPR